MRGRRTSTDAVGRLEQELLTVYSICILATDVAASRRGEDRATYRCAIPGGKVMISPTPMRGPVERKSRRLTLALCPSDTAYDYELAKLPHDIVLLGNTHRQWDSAIRPLPETVRVSYTLDGARADILILGIDQWSFDEIEQRALFLRLCDRFRGPKIIVNHGCNMVDGCSAEIMRELVGQHIMVSRTAPPRTVECGTFARGDAGLYRKRVARKRL